MGPQASADVACEQVHPTLRVRDVRAAAAYYVDRLGFRLDFTSGEPPTFAGVSLGRVQVFLEQGEPDPRGASV